MTVVWNLKWDRISLIIKMNKNIYKKLAALWRRKLEDKEEKRTQRHQRHHILDNDCSYLQFLIYIKLKIKLDKTPQNL